MAYYYITESPLTSYASLYNKGRGMNAYDYGFGKSPTVYTYVHMCVGISVHQ